MNNKINFNFSNLKVDQLGYVYKDIRKQAKIMETFFGIPKFTILGPVELDAFYRGRETKFKALGAWSRLFDNTEIELLQHYDGESLFKEFLDQGKEGLHHVRFEVDGLSAVIEECKNKGVEVIQKGKLLTINYAYMDTEPILGIILEFVEMKKGRKRR